MGDSKGLKPLVGHDIKDIGNDVEDKGINNSLESYILNNLITFFKEKLLSRLKGEEQTDVIIENLTSWKYTDVVSFFRYLALIYVSKLKPKDISRQYKSDDFLRPKNNNNILEIREIEDKLIKIFIDGGFGYCDVSPLQPLGTSYHIGKNSPSKVLISGNKELLNDPTYSLTLEGVKQIQQNEQNKQIKLFTLATSIRNQKFSNPLYLPYFKTISGTVILGQDKTLEDFDKTISDIINYNLQFLNNIKDIIGIKNIKLQLSHGLVLYDILKKNKKFSEQEAKKLVYNYRKKYGNAFESDILKENNIDIKYNFSANDVKQSEYSKYFENLLNNINYDLISDPNIEINLSRLAGLGHYNNIMFTIFIETEDGLLTDIIDGGGVNWTNELLSTKGYKQVVFGVGTELLQNLNK